MNNKNVTVLEKIAVDRRYQNQIINFQGHKEYKIRTQSVIPKINSLTDLQMIIDNGMILKNTYGFSFPIYKANDILYDRIINSKQKGIITESVDQEFIEALHNSTLIFEPEVEQLAYKNTSQNYLQFLKTLVGKNLFVNKLEEAFSGNKKDLHKYEEAWSDLIKNDKEIIKLSEAYLLHQIKLLAKFPIGFTRMIEAYSTESVDHAAALNREANTICESNGWAKTLNICIGPTALSKTSLIKKLCSDILEKGKFGIDFDFAYFSFPNYGIRSSIAQWKNMETIFKMVDTLKNHGIVVAFGNVDWALAEVCMARGIHFASTSISGKRVIAFGRGNNRKGQLPYGKMPIPELFDWQEFYSFNDDFNQNGKIYPYYSPHAVKLNGEDLLRYKPKAMNILRREIFLEAIENQNAYRINAAKRGEVLEGTIKKLWESSKPDYTKLLAFNPFEEDEKNLSTTLGENRIDDN